MNTNSAAAGCVSPWQPHTVVYLDSAASGTGSPYSGHAAAAQQQSPLCLSTDGGPVVVPVGPTATIVPVGSPQGQESEGRRATGGEASMASLGWEHFNDEEVRT